LAAISVEKRFKNESQGSWTTLTDAGLFFVHVADLLQVVSRIPLCPQDVHFLNCGAFFNWGFFNWGFFFRWCFSRSWCAGSQH
jgi:hypothetical protein